MVSFWPWKRDDASPASFERALSTLSTKIAATQAQLDKLRATARRVKVLSTLYLGFAYLVYAIVAILVVGWQSMGPLEWTGMAGGPVVIYLVRTVTTLFYDYRIERLNARLKAQQTERTKTIQKLKDATKYDSTLELLEKYGGSENKPKKGSKKKSGGDGDGADTNSGGENKGKKIPNRTNMPPPPTANIQRLPPSAPSTPQPRSHSAFGSNSPQQPPSHSPAQQDMDISAEFAPNAFDGKGTSSFVQYPSAPMLPSESHWYDRILDTLLGEDETAAKNRIVLICGRCRLVNGQAPPGTKSLADLGGWKCMACGAANGELDEGKRIVQEVLGQRSPESRAAETTDDDMDAEGNWSNLVEVEKEESAEEGPRKRKGNKSL
ncbi:hypothetical protein B0H63DRAFT_287665 [Podospora didyma]|uniref:Endoplasmic reticulum junction formation protein lunapark n=1 Tax=Podospora didyma TaxID=330526 RepID=A0AAE0N6L4_9PEZI|nr:hypothetical protein B0H63DRAFT_287665 [Podospora didyma]